MKSLITMKYSVGFFLFITYSRSRRVLSKLEDVIVSFSTTRYLAAVFEACGYTDIALLLNSHIETESEEPVSAFCETSP